MAYSGNLVPGDNRFEMLVRSVTDYAIYMLDPTGIVTSWNAGAERFKGYSEEEILGQHFSRFYGAEDQAAGLPARALATAEREGRFEAEGWRMRKDGTRFWANVVIDPVRDASGTLVGFAKVTRDLTERKAADEALRRSEEVFRLLVHSVTDYAIYMLDPEGHVGSWNAGAQRFKGYAADEIMGEHFSRFYTDEDRATGLPARALATARDEGRFEAEGWRVRKDGTRFWASVVIDPVRDETGRLIGFAKVTRDLSERREAQQALEQAQAAFFQSQKMDAIGQLTGGVAHDFNNLLAAVIGSLDLAKRRAATGADISRFIDNALMAAERGASLTQRMLAFARKQELALQTVDLAELVRGMAEMLDRTLGGAVMIETRFPLKLASIEADPGQLELALINLAVNARDAMQDGGTITIGARAERVIGDPALTDGDYVRLSVTDSGEGMDEATLARAMEPFFTTKGIGKGTGLGLSMVHGLTEQSGGKMEIRSSKGVGTTIDLWLRASTAQSPALPRAAAAAPARRGADALTVLAVDDDVLVLTNTTAMLEDLGHVVLQASTAAQAIMLIESNPVDMVLTDYAMPEMTGAQLADIVAARWPDAMVLMVSGYAEIPPDVAVNVPRLAKPFREEQLSQAMARLRQARAAGGKILSFPQRARSEA